MGGSKIKATKRQTGQIWAVSVVNYVLPRNPKGNHIDSIKALVETSAVILEPLRPSTTLVAGFVYVCTQLSDVFWEVLAAMGISEYRIRVLSLQGPKVVALSA